VRRSWEGRGEEEKGSQAGGDANTLIADDRTVWKR